MKLNVKITEFIPARVEKVWATLTDAECLAEWLMPNDFVAEVGKKFTFVPDHETPWGSNVECEVLELLPPKKMVWSWKTNGMEYPSRVEFELIPEPAGTQLVFRHGGEAHEPVAKGLKGGWPDRFDRLTSTLEKQAFVVRKESGAS